MGVRGTAGAGDEGPEWAVVVAERKRAGARVGGARAQELCGPVLSVSGAGRPPWRSCSPCTRSGTCSSMAPTRSAASNWTMGSWQVGAPMAPGIPTPPLIQLTAVFSCPNPTQPAPRASWESPCRPLSPFPNSPAPAPLRPELRGFWAHTHWASPHRAPGTADVCDAALWWGRGKCARGA